MSLLRPALRLARAPLARPLARFASSSAEAAVVPAEELNLKPQPAAPAQSPNVPTPWSDNQEPKKDAFNQARFEQTDYALQPDGLSAMGLVSEQPVVKVQGRKAVCNGGECEARGAEVPRLRWSRGGRAGRGTGGGGRRKGVEGEREE